MSASRIDGAAVLEAASVALHAHAPAPVAQDIDRLRVAFDELMAATDAYLSDTARLMEAYPIGTAIPGFELDGRKRKRDRVFQAFKACGGG